MWGNYGIIALSDPNEPYQVTALQIHKQIFQNRIFVDFIKIIIKNNFKFWSAKMNKVVFCVYGEDYACRNQRFSQRPDRPQI